MITLHYDDKTLKVQPNDSSYRYRSLMAKPQLVLRFSLPEYVEIPVGAWCEYMGERYILHSPQNIKKNGVRNIEYTLNMGTLQDNLALYKLRNSVDHRLKFGITAKPHEFIAEIVANLNERDGAGVWSIGTCIDSNEKTIEFNHTNIDSALSQVAETFETEWEIVGNVISLHKVEYYKNDPLPLSYGKGNGFMPGVGRTTPSNELPIKRLYVQGGDRNIDRSKYGSQYLLLPKSQQLVYEGRTYQSDADGYYIERVDKISDAVKEDSIDCSESYPSRIGTVTSVIAVKPEKNFYDFIDNTIPEDLDFNDYIIEGETATIIFQSGMLAGKEFEFKYKHSERRFEIVPQEIDGQTMPNSIYKPNASGTPDTYAIFGIMLPQSYICDNEAKEGASWDMFREAAKHLYENEDQKFTFTGTLQSLYAKRNWVNIGGKLIVGGYIHFSDAQFAQDGVDIRIVGIKDFLTSPYSPTVEISNNVSGQSLTSKLREIDAQEVVIEENHKDALQFTRRRFRDAQETLSMLEDALDNFSGSVNPITVQTMAMLVGDESLQFQFVTGLSSTTIDTSFQVTYDAANKQLSVPHSFLRHMTLGIDAIKSSHSIDEYKTWEMTAYVSARLEDGSKKYYLYAKVDTAVAQNGEFLLSETPIDMDRDAGYYYLLVGILNSELDEQRSYVSLYGFTEILPARITTERIVSADGKTFVDLAGNAMKLGDALDFNTAGDGKLLLKGTIVQSLSGDSNYIGCYRGVYNSSYIYFQGDEVSYTIGGCTSTYRYIHPTETSGIAPTDTDHWQVIAEGVKGDKGDKGEKGDSPALVFRGTYDSSATYYGNANRVDCVKYNGVYYVARIDAGTFSGYIPTNTTYWNTFGAQFESVATQLLLAENANIAGWVFRNNRLESQNGSVYLDGVNGKVRLNGTLQLSTAYQGNISDSNIFYLPAITSEQNLTMGHELDDIGKVCRLFNSSPFGGADYLIYLNTFGIAADGLSVDATFGTVIVRLKPQEHIELTCYELKPKSLYSSSFQMYMDTCAKWDMTNRFGFDNYRSAYARGRYPLIMAIMRITGSDSGVSVSGEFWNGKSIPLIFNASRIDTGHYKVSFDSDVLPSGYKIIASGFGTALNEGTPIKATIMAIESTYFEIYTSDDASRNDGSCDLVIFSPNWSYVQ